MYRSVPEKACKNIDISIKYTKHQYKNVNFKRVYSLLIYHKQKQVRA